MIRRLFVSLVLCAIVLIAAGRARAEPVRILIAAGHGAGTSGEQPLRYAHDDARRVGDVLTAVGGVHRENAIVLEEPTPQALGAAFDRARAIAAAHRPDEVTLLFYFSGHGDHDSLHVGGRAVPLADIAAQIGAVPAALKIAIVDACRNVRDRPKGITTEPAFAISLTAPAATGAVWLHASADGEAAQESDDLGGAIFTHYWVAGLRGAADANGDGKVTLAESYDFAYGQTLYRSARGTGALQRPAASFSIREAYPVVLTVTNATSALKLPKSADAQYIVYALGSRTVAGEAWGSPDRSVVLAMPAGRYVIQRRAPGASGALEVSLGGGEQRELRASEFRPFEQETLAQKGGEIVVYPNELSFGYGARSGGLFTFGQELRWRYAYRFGRFALSFGTHAGIGTESTDAEDVHVSWLGAGARFEYRLPVGAVELSFGAGPIAQVIAQRFDRTDAGRVSLAGYPTRQSFHAFAWGGDAALGARTKIVGRLALVVEAEGSLLFADTSGAEKPFGALGLGAGLLFSF